MKTIIIFIFAAFFINPTVDKLNTLKRQYMWCNDGTIEKWKIDCASNFEINFLDAKLLSKRNKKYEIAGEVVSDKYNFYQGGFAGINIQYGNGSGEICNAKEIGVTDSLGKFKIQVVLKKENFLIFHSVGFKTVFIQLNIDE